MRMAIVLGSLVILAACSNPVRQDSDALIEAKNAEIETLERQIQVLQARKTASGQAATLEEILQKVEADSKELSEEDRSSIGGGNAHGRAYSRPTPAQRETFGALTDFIGHRFKGVSTSDTADAKADIQSWSWALGGSAILIKHVLEDGSYGGDTYVYKDASTGDLVYVYITNAGFRTEGAMTVNEDGGYTAEEAVTGHDTITMVRSTSRPNEDGSSTVTSEILENGEWRTGHGFTYAPTNEYLPALTPPTPE